LSLHLDTAHIQLSSAQLKVLPALPIELEDPSIIPIAKNKSRVLSGYFLFGKGKVGFQLLQETFRLGVEGYSTLWSNLIKSTSRSQNSNYKIRLAEPFPYYSNEPMGVEVISSGRQPHLLSDSVTISMKESSLVDDYWTTRNWAGRNGWHKLCIKQDSAQLSYFVSDTSEWKALRLQNQMNANQVFQKTSNSKETKAIKKTSISKLIFYFIFLISSAFLWLGPKIQA
jgi:hypothetical protein